LSKRRRDKEIASHLVRVHRGEECSSRRGIGYKGFLASELLAANVTQKPQVFTPTSPRETGTELGRTSRKEESAKESDRIGIRAAKSLL